jgi:predicted MFS family arabinose efflux permease
VGVLVGWRWTYLGVAVAAALVIYGGLRLPRQPASGRSSRDGQGAPVDALVVTAVAATLSSAGVTSLAAFFPAWAYETGLSPGLGGLLLAAGSALSLVGRIVSGIAADRRGRRHLPVVAAQLAAGAFALLLISAGSLPSLLVGALIAFGIGWSWPGLLLLSIVRVGRSNPGGASSAVQVGAFAGGCAGPVIFGLLVDTASYPVAWRTAAAALLVAAGLLLAARRMFLKDLRQRPVRRS